MNIRTFIFHGTLVSIFYILFTAYSNVNAHYTTVDTLCSFKKGDIFAWDSKGNVYFDDTCDYKHHYYKSVFDSERNKLVGEFIFPRVTKVLNPTLCDRSFEINVRGDSRPFSQFSFFAKKTRGSQSRLYINLNTIDGKWYRYEYNDTFGISIDTAWGEVHKLHLCNFVNFDYPYNHLSAEAYDSITSLAVKSNSSDSMVVRLSDITIEHNSDFQSFPVFITRPMHAPWAFFNNEPVKLEYLLSSGLSTSERCTLCVKCKRYPTEDTSTVTFDGFIQPGTIIASFSLGTLPTGYYEATSSLRHGGILDSVTDAFIVGPQTYYYENSAQLLDSCVVGLNTMRQSFSYNLFKSIKKAGFDRVRIMFNNVWRTIEPEEDSINYTTFSGIVQLADSTGVSLMPLLGYAPSWASGVPKHPKLNINETWSIYRLNQWRPPEDTSIFKQRITNIVHHYKDSIKYWEFCNEPDWNQSADTNNMKYFWETSDYYYKLLKIAYDTIKTVDTSINLVSGGLSYFDGTTDTSFTKNLLDSVPNSFDMFGIHAYAPYDTIKKRSLDYLYQTKGTSFPIYQTEVNQGFTEALSVEEAKQWFSTAVMNALYPLFKNCNMRYFSFFNIKPRLMKQNPGECSLLSTNGAPEPRLALFAQWARIFTGSSMPRYEGADTTLIVGVNDTVWSLSMKTPFIRTEGINSECLMLFGKGDITIYPSDTVAYGDSMVHCYDEFGVLLSDTLKLCHDTLTLGQNNQRTVRYIVAPGMSPQMRFRAVD